MSRFKCFSLYFVCVGTKFKILFKILYVAFDKPYRLKFITFPTRSSLSLVAFLIFLHSFLMFALFMQ